MYKDKRVEIESYVRKIEYYKYTLNSLLYWDKITQMPTEGIGYRSEVMGFLGEELYKLLSSSKLQELIKYFDGNLQNDRITNSMVKKIIRSTMYVSKIPQAEYRDYIQLIANAEQVWERARIEDDFSMIEPYLEKLLVHYKNFARYWGYENNIYDAWLGYYEEGIDSERMGEMIDIVKPAILDILEKIRSKDDGCEIEALKGIESVSQENQLNLTKMILDAVGFSFERGRVDLGAHTTILSSSPNDVRLVTSYYDENLQRSILNAMYLGGKGLYEQNIDCKLLGTMLAEACSFAMEESIGKLYENTIGRSRKFWEYVTPIIEGEIPEIKGVHCERLFMEVNKVNITPVRLDADELTAMIHIIIRYELEKDLINGVIEVSQLPEAWNKKYIEYLGVEPKTHREGVLQDIHWVAGYFGYFASYLFSGLACAQFSHFVDKEMKGDEALSGKDMFEFFNEWLKTKVYKFGGIYSSSELIENACGEPLNASYYVDYLKSRFTEVYGL